MPNETRLRDDLTSRATSVWAYLDAEIKECGDKDVIAKDILHIIGSAVSMYREACNDPCARDI